MKKKTSIRRHFWFILWMWLNRIGIVFALPVIWNCVKKDDMFGFIFFSFCLWGNGNCWWDQSEWSKERNLKLRRVSIKESAASPTTTRRDAAM